MNLFTQVETSSSRQQGGAGLGLAISKQLVSLMGGEIGVDSRLDQGATFWFTLPLLETAQSASPEPLARPAFTPLSAVKVMIVDDNEINRTIAQLQLESLGIEALVFGGGAEALAALAEDHYDLILMDCQMPGMDGYETTRKIRSREHSQQHTPIVALTAHAMKGERERCLQAGMDDYLSKPMRLEDVQQTLERWLGAGASEIRSLQPK